MPAGRDAVLRSAAAILLAAGCFVGLARGLGEPIDGVGTAAHVLRFATRDGHLTDESGRTVYAWLGDRPGRSACVTPCSVIWPPVLVSYDPVAEPGLQASRLSTLVRPDGTRQASYAGRPLYYFGADVEPGDGFGQNKRSYGALWCELDAAGTPIVTHR